MTRTKSAKTALRKAEMLERLKGAADHSPSCMCSSLLPTSLQTRPHCGWYDLIDFDPCVEPDQLLSDKPLTEWTQVAYGKAREGKTLLSEYRVYVDDEQLHGFWSGLVVWQRDSSGYVRCPFPGCDIRLMGKSAVHTLMLRHWKYQHAQPYLCNVCGSSYATDGALKVHFFRTRHNQEGAAKAKGGRAGKGLARQSFSVHRRQAIMHYINKVERLVRENKK